MQNPVAVHKSSEHPVILLGASVRSLAQSAVSRGWPVICCDFFHDSDLTHLLTATGNRLLPPLRSFGDAPDRLAQVPSDIPLVWCGGLENLPEVLEQLSQQRPVLGSPIASIRCLRDPFQLRSVLSPANLRTPHIRLLSETTNHFPDDSASIDTDRSAPPVSWLVKPYASAGGQNIHRLKGFCCGPNQQRFAEQSLTANTYLQEEISGVAMSATFLCDPASSPRPIWLGACLQFSGLESLNAAEFQHCGNLGPLCLPDRIVSTLQLAANSVHHAFPLRGLFGIDFILRDGVPVFLEVNPRPTASHVHLDSVAHVPLIELHLNACGVPHHGGHAVGDYHRSDSSKPADLGHQTAREVSCSLVLYAANEVSLSRDEVSDLMMSSGLVTDIPQPDIPTPRGAPLLTLQFRATLPRELCQRIRNCLLPPALKSHIDRNRAGDELDHVLTNFLQHCKP